MWIGTWNVNGKLLREDAVRWIQSTTELNTDMYILGLEEIVPLNPLTILFEYGVDSQRQEWIQFIQEVLQDIHHMSFTCLSSVSMVGLFLAVFVPSTKTTMYSTISTGKVATGMIGFTGNKGAVSIRLQINNSRIIFICSHLTPHQWFIQERNHDFHKFRMIGRVNCRIWDEMLFEDQSMISPTDCVIWV